MTVTVTGGPGAKFACYYAQNPLSCIGHMQCYPCHPGATIFRASFGKAFCTVLSADESLWTHDDACLPRTCSCGCKWHGAQKCHAEQETAALRCPPSRQCGKAGNDSVIYTLGNMSKGTQRSVLRSSEPQVFTVDMFQGLSMTESSQLGPSDCSGNLKYIYLYICVCLYMLPKASEMQETQQ